MHETRPFRRLLRLLAGCLLALLVACGGDDSGSDASDAATVDDSAAGDSGDAADGDTGDTDSTDDESGDSAETDSSGDDSGDSAGTDSSGDGDEPPPATEPPAPVVDFDLTQLDELAQLAADATADGSIDAFDVVEQITGFPTAVEAPADTRLHILEASLGFVSDEVAGWDFAYEVVSPDAVPDIDINAEDNGPGSAFIIETYDPILSSLGYARSSSTGSDPGDPGGPQSVNHVYQPDTSAATVNGVAGELGNVWVWLHEDIVGGDFNDDIDIAPGLRFTQDFDTDPAAGIPVPLLAALEAEIPVPDSAVLDEADVRLRTRGGDGLQILTLRYVWYAPAADYDGIVEFYSDPSVFGNEAVLIAGEPGFPDDTVIERAEVNDYGSRFSQPVMLNSTWPGEIEFEADVGQNGEARIIFDVEVAPDATPLGPAEE